MFDNATNFTIFGGHFTNYGQMHNHYHGRNGLQILLESSIPEAAHDSSARSSQLSCLPGTRKQYISDITGWVRAHNVALSVEGSDERHDRGRPHHRLMWLSGPAGVGKSAVAQTCAEILQESSELGAAFFFSRPNQRDKSDKFFTSIAYQLATCRRPATSPYGALLEKAIRKDPSVVTKSLEVQLHELIVDPVLDLLENGGRAHPHQVVIIVDGLDECDGSGAQCEILRLITTATLEYPDLPLLWAIFSRPEPHIESTILEFDSSWWKIILPISQDTDRDIELYLKSNFARIQQRYNLSLGSTSWPSEADIRALVRKSAGLFVYAATLIRFFDDSSLPDREQQLADLLSPQSPSASSSVSPLSHLDAFYTLIMQRIPQLSLPYTLNVLLILTSPLIASSLTVTKVSDLLGYTTSTTLSAIYTLRSVLFLQSDSVGNRELRDTQGSKDMKISFYHYSFVEFLRNQARSGKFYVFQPMCRLFWARRCLQILSEFDQGGLAAITLRNGNTQPQEQAMELQKNLFIEASCSFLESCARIPNLRDFPDLIQQLYALDFGRIVISAGINIQHLVMCIREEDLVELMKQLDSYAWDHGRSLKMPKLLRERLSAANWMTRSILNIKYKIDSAINWRTNSSDSTSSSASSFSFSSLGSASSASPTPSRVLSVYELGLGDKKVYLYPELASFGVMYHVCTSVDELKEPYIFSSVGDENTGA